MFVLFVEFLNEVSVELLDTLTLDVFNDITKVSIALSTYQTIRR